MRILNPETNASINEQLALLREHHPDLLEALYEQHVFTSKTGRLNVSALARHLGTTPARTKTMLDKARMLLDGEPTPPAPAEPTEPPQEPPRPRRERPRKVTAEALQEVLEALRRGEPHYQIAARYNVVRATISAIARQHGLCRKPQRKSKVDREAVYALVDAGLTQAEAARRLNVAPSSVGLLCRMRKILKASN